MSQTNFTTATTKAEALAGINANFTELYGRSVIPSGAMLPFGGSSAPSGFLLCDGAAVSRSTYSSLFAAIGTAYGIGDGTTTFNVPAFADRVPIGAGGSLATLGQQIGQATHTLSDSELPSESLPLPAIPTSLSGSPSLMADHNADGTQVATLAIGDITLSTTPTSNLTFGGGASHNNVQPSLGVNFIIKT